MPKSKTTRDTSSMDTDSQPGDGGSAETSTRARPQRARQPPKRYQQTPEPETFDIVGDESKPSAETVDVPQPQPAPSRPRKSKATTSTAKRPRKKAVVDSDDERDAPRASTPPEAHSRIAEPDPAEDDLSVGHPSPLHSPQAGSSKKRLTLGRKRKASDSDEERDDYGARASHGRTDSDADDSFIADSPPPQKRKKSLPPVKSRGVKGRDKEIVLGKDERAARTASRDEGTPMDIETTPSASPAPTTTSGPASSMPTFKKKLPSMRKTSSVAGSSAGSGTPARSRPKPADPPAADEPDSSLDFKKPKKVAAKQELNLMDKSTYASLFKSGSAPRGGVDVKSKEEKRAAMNKLRDEDCARREAQWSNTFDLRAQYEKVTGFAKRMEARQGPSVYPNILASSLRTEFIKRRKQGQGQS
ncbi:hypothetical protein PENSPDRAFT_690317 [Peniophora sp. CONT]|nr:hypothetical protein PENSPDRAFT_690317 [Peniophora sp. CONT]